MRLRWLSLENPEGKTGRVVATRYTLLRQLVQDCRLYGLPDPLERLPELLGRTVQGSLSTIHGDLNLENVLVGPGNIVWLIDFATTRDGHALFDFAHLAADVIAHLVATQHAPEAYLNALPASFTQPGGPPALDLLHTVHAIALRCLANPLQPQEYYLSLYATCLGALKFTNLDQPARQLLYLTAAYLSLQV